MRTINIHALGPSGSGKTVFMAAMYRQLRIKRANSARPAGAKPLPARPNSVSSTRRTGNQPADSGSGYRCPVAAPRNTSLNQAGNVLA